MTSGTVPKRHLSERDISTKFVMPALRSAGWDSASQIREEVALTDGRIIVRGKLAARARPRRADFVLYLKPGIPLAVIEVKSNKADIGSGLQQGLKYAQMLDVPFTFSTNGDGFLFHDASGSLGVVETTLSLHEFPSPEQLWAKLIAAKDASPGVSETLAQPYYDDGSGKAPRYYQAAAVNRTIEAIAKGQPRILLTMATGTGKTYTAFQIIWRLWSAGIKKRILFLADRNILVDQTIINDFQPFGSVMTKVRDRNVDTSYEVYLALYQGLTGNTEDYEVYKQFPTDFFDLVIVDECHRGSASDNSSWRPILNHFGSATQIGLTATPKETTDASNTEYFGEPIYIYSLRDGIEDGFLAPYKVVRVDIDRDVLGWRPEHGQLDDHGSVIEDKIYDQSNFDRDLILPKRNELVAKKIAEFLESNDPFGKAIVFCEDIAHAERMRSALVNAIPIRSAQNSRYVVRITGDSVEGAADLDDFIDPASIYPVIATTSRLLSTGVDAKTCKLIVLDRTIKSMTEFKQIIGRGTRVDEEHGKLYFTILDFRRATELFSDSSFDGDPVQIYERNLEDSVDLNDQETDYSIQIQEEIPLVEEREDSTRKRYVVGSLSVDVVSERVQYYGDGGKLITESLKDYTRKRVLKQFESLDAFLSRWSESARKTAILEELEAHGLLLDALIAEDAEGLDIFDLICSVAYGVPAIPRRERAERVRGRGFIERYSGTAQKVLYSLLDKFADQGVQEIENLNVLRLPPFPSIGTPVEIVKQFGGRQEYFEAVSALENEIYAVG